MTTSWSSDKVPENKSSISLNEKFRPSVRWMDWSSVAGSGRSRRPALSKLQAAKCECSNPQHHTKSTPLDANHHHLDVANEKMARSTPISRHVGRLSRSQVAAKRGLFKGAFCACAEVAAREGG